MREPTAISTLSPRELEIALAYGSGASYRDIAERLFIAPSTVRTHLQSIYRKLHVSSKVELIRALAVNYNSSRNDASLPGKPSIAVLRFSNFNDDDCGCHFAEGIANDIIAELSKFRELSVASRHSSFCFQPGSEQSRRVGAELGINYIIEGGVQRDGNRVRITCQLVDADTAFCLWSERFSREGADLFAVQDEIVQRVAATVAGRVKAAATDRALRQSPVTMTASNYVLRGESILASTKDENLHARESFERAVDLNPKCARAYVGLALSHVIADFNGWAEPCDAPLERALWYAEMAVSADKADGRAHALLGHVYGELRDFAAAELHLCRALDLNSSDPETYAYLAVNKEQIGHPEAAIELFLKAMGLNPFYPAWYLWKLGTSYYFAGDYENAVLTLRQAVVRVPKFKRARMALAAAYAQIRQDEEAAKQVCELLKYHPDASLKNEQHVYLNWPNFIEDAWLDGLRKAALPE